MSYNNYNRGYAEPTMTSADYMTRTYRWMALGLLVTFAAAFVTATTPLFYVVNSLYLLFTIAELALVFVLSARVQNMSVGAARGVFLGYALLNGMVLSYYFLAFEVGTLVLAFLATSLYFGLMAVYGTTTHKDLSGWGPKLMIALFAAYYRFRWCAVWYGLYGHGAVFRHRSGGVYAADRLRHPETEPDVLLLRRGQRAGGKGFHLRRTDAVSGLHQHLPVCGASAGSQQPPPRLSVQRCNIIDKLKIGQACGSDRFFVL